MNIGELTHSAFQGKGLGKAVFGALCAWSIKNGYIAQYRHDSDHPIQRKPTWHGSISPR